MRTSYSLNRINEIHENEISENDDDINDETGNGVSVDTDNIDATDNTNNSDKDAHPNSSRMRRQFTPQLSSESEGRVDHGIYCEVFFQKLSTLCTHDTWITFKNFDNGNVNWLRQHLY